MENLKYILRRMTTQTWKVGLNLWLVSYIVIRNFFGRCQNFYALLRLPQRGLLLNPIVATMWFWWRISKIPRYGYQNLKYILRRMTTQTWKFGLNLLLLSYIVIRNFCWVLSIFQCWDGAGTATRGRLPLLSDIFLM